MNVGDKMPCPNCEGVDMVYTVESAVCEMHGTQITLDMHVLSCDGCKNSYETTHMSNLNVLAMLDAYKAATGKQLAPELFSEEIKQEISQYEQDHRTGE